MSRNGERVETVSQPHGPAGPGVLVRNYPLGFWRWRAWPHVNAGRSDWFSKSGWARSEDAAYEAGMRVLVAADVLSIPKKGK